MRTGFLPAAVSLVSLAMLDGCVARPFGGPDMTALMRQNQEMQKQVMKSQDNMLSKSKLRTEMMSHPDLTEWHDQREKIAFAVGDRQFDKAFDRVFESMIVALATLGCRVQNIERGSGYISASIPELPPAQLQALQQESQRQYAVAKGYPADIFDRKAGPYDIDFDYSAMMSRQSGLTLSMVRQDTNTTKVKLRFDNVYYPPMIEQYYAMVWQAVDKQMFLDKALD